MILLEICIERLHYFIYELYYHISCCLNDIDTASLSNFESMHSVFVKLFLYIIYDYYFGWYYSPLYSYIFSVDCIYEEEHYLETRVTCFHYVLFLWKQWTNIWFLVANEIAHAFIMTCQCMGFVRGIVHFWHVMFWYLRCSYVTKPMMYEEIICKLFRQ